ncbi:MAG: hypothetical protein J6S24_10690, partial [Lentisphaeria bacterium]|nr:hypothetical protein [Lentisphaeria bacterium]
PLLPNYGAVMIDEAHTLENNAADHLGLHISKGALIGVLNRLYNPDNARGLLLKSGADAMELRALTVEARDELTDISVSLKICWRAATRVQ